MEHQSRTVVGAFVVGFAMIGAAIYAVNTAPTAPSEQGPALAVVSDPSFARQAIPERDQNGDGQPDWKEALTQVSAPALPIATSSDFERQETLTTELGISLFKGLVSQRNANTDNPQAIIEQATAQAGEMILTQTLSVDGLTVISESKLTNELLLDYFNAMARELSGPAEPTSVLILLDRAINQNDVEAAERINEIDDKFSAAMKKIEQIPVPEPMVEQHLNLVNALRFIQDDISAFTNPARDPMRTLLHVKRYLDDQKAVQIALSQFVAHPPTFIDLSNTSLTKDDPAFFFVRLYHYYSENGMI